MNRFSWRARMILTPSFIWIVLINRKKISSNEDAAIYDFQHAEWSSSSSLDEERTRDALGVVYDGVGDRKASLEARSIGLLTVVAILAAIDAVTVTGTLVPRLLSMLAFIFLFFTGLGCWYELFPRQRYSLVLGDVSSATTGAAEMAASVAASERTNLRLANMVTSASYDLVKSLLLTLAALGTFVAVK
jgi:hypothetical protein